MKGNERKAVVTFGELLLRLDPPGACDVIRRLRESHGGRVVVSAGTVTTAEQVRAAIESAREAGVIRRKICEEGGNYRPWFSPC